MKTKGALLRGFGRPWSIEPIEIGEPRPGEIKVQMEASGMCHTDHHLVTGAMPMAGFPVLGGHEGAGVVVEIGDGVEDFAPGDHVVMSFIPACGQCPSCQDGLRNLCVRGALVLGGRAVSDDSFRVTAEDQPVYPMTLLGTFSPYMVVHQSSAVKIDPAIPFDVACLVGCGVTTGYGAATRTAQVRAGEDVAVIGVGGVGISALQGAANSGARFVFAVDPVEWKRDQALKFGATHAYPDITTATAGIAEVTAGEMAQKVLLTMSELRGSELQDYLNITSKAGTCVIVAMGDLAENTATVNLSIMALLQKEVKGTLFGGSNPHRDIPHLLSMYQAGKLNIADMITREYRLEQINDGYRDMLDGKNIRGIIRYTDADR